MASIALVCGCFPHSFKPFTLRGKEARKHSEAWDSLLRYCFRCAQRTSAALQLVAQLRFIREARVSAALDPLLTLCVSARRNNVVRGRCARVAIHDDHEKKKRETQ